MWLDPAKTSPYEFYQYWRNIEDVKVEECLGLLTFLPMDEVRRLGALEGSEINTAKEILAYEITRIVHGQEEADKARETSKSFFGGAKDNADIPTTKVELDGDEISLVDLLVISKLAPSKSEARRLIESGSVSVNDDKVTDRNAAVAKEAIEGGLILKKGKKTFHKITL